MGVRCSQSQERRIPTSRNESMHDSDIWLGETSGVVDRQAANLSELSRQSIVIDPEAAVHQFILEVCESSLQQRPAGTHCPALREHKTADQMAANQGSQLLAFSMACAASGVTPSFTRLQKHVLYCRANTGNFPGAFSLPNIKRSLCQIMPSVS